MSARRPQWDDREWEQLWERSLDHVERHRLARSTWRRERPKDVLERRVIPELARRYCRSARNHGLFHLLWVLFWGSIAWSADPAQGQAEQVAGSMALFSAMVIGVCLWIRRHLDPVTRYG